MNTPETLSYLNPVACVDAPLFSVWLFVAFENTFPAPRWQSKSLRFVCLFSLFDFTPSP